MENEKKYTHLGLCNGYDIFVDWRDNPNGHMMVTGISGTGKTNFLKQIVNQNIDYINIILDYSASFCEFGNAAKISILDTDEIQNFFDDLSEATIGTIADAIQGAERLGVAQKSAVVKALCFMMKPIEEIEIMSCEDDLFKPYIKFENGMAERNWALFAFLLYTRCGTKGEQIATRLIDLVYKLSKSCEKSDRDKHHTSSTVIIEFPIECSGLNAKLAELYLWKIWLHEVKERKRMTIILDECQDLCWKKGSIAERLLSEGRKFGIGLILSTQFLNSNFPKRVINSFMESGLRVIFAPPETEVKEIAQSLDSTNWKSWQKHLRNLRVGTCIICGVLRFKGRTSKQKLIVKVPEYIDQGNKKLEEDKSNGWEKN